MKPGCILSKFYIKPQRRRRPYLRRRSCILSKFYIKPQLKPTKCLWNIRCILSKFYIKPQLQLHDIARSLRCILSKFYIKPQLWEQVFAINKVVSYRNSTSNHNRWMHRPSSTKLYLIEILHQTTTTLYRFR